MIRSFFTPGAIAVLLALMVSAQPVSADPQSKSFSHWRFVGDKVSATFTTPMREASRLQASSNTHALAIAWQQHLSTGIQVQQEQPCPLLSREILPSDPVNARVRLQWQCTKEVQTLDLTLNILFDRVGSHVHFANFHLPESRRAEHLFSQSARNFQLALWPGDEEANANSGPVLTTYIQFGFEHILIGLDHIAFILTLLLLRGNWRHLLWTITGFTLGHSVTLSLSALELVSPDIEFIEALIGWSIALVAIESVNARRTSGPNAGLLIAAVLLLITTIDAISIQRLPTLAMLGLALFSGCFLQLSDSPAQSLRLRPFVTALFGLVHGFGFASVLLEVGLPASSRPLALAGFNIGVELGQLVIVLGLLAAANLAMRSLRGRGTAAPDLLAGALCGLGVYWFLQRLYL